MKRHVWLWPLCEGNFVNCRIQWSGPFASWLCWRIPVGVAFPGPPSNRKWKECVWGDKKGIASGVFVGGFLRLLGFRKSWVYCWYLFGSTHSVTVAKWRFVWVSDYNYTNRGGGCYWVIQGICLNGATYFDRSWRELRTICLFWIIMIYVFYG